MIILTNIDLKRKIDELINTSFKKIELIKENNHTLFAVSIAS